MCSELGVQCRLKIKTDASAAKGIASRTGTGKIKHIEISQLWLQQKVNMGDIQIIKVDGKSNLADTLTKYVTAEDISVHMSGTSLCIASGRHELMPRPDATGDVVNDAHDVAQHEEEESEHV